MEQQFYTLEKPFLLESGESVKDVRIGYHTYGTKKDNNVVWVCHALTANSNSPQWWPGITGEAGVFNPEEHYIVSANIFGSCYGTTGPLDINPETGSPYYYEFPEFTLRDIVRLHNELRKHLGIEKIHVCIGGSCGGNQVLEFALIEPDLIENIVVLAASARETAWSIAVHETQRMAISMDKTWGEKQDRAGVDGMKTARGIGLLTYRTQEAYIENQTDEDNDKITGFKASSYIQYQGEKLAKRFNAFSYWFLINALDTHNVGRGRGSIEVALNQIKSKALIIGIDTDILIPVNEQKFLAEHIPAAHFCEIQSPYGHDGFLIEQEKISIAIKKFLNDGFQSISKSSYALC